MSDLKETAGFYAERIRGGIAAIIPGPKNWKNNLKSFLRGATTALAITFSVSFLFAIALLVSQKVGDMSSLARIGAGLATGSFGSFVTLGAAADTQNVQVGVHSLLIALVALVVSYRAGKRLSSPRSTETFTPVHYALGFTAFLAALGFVIQGTIETSFAGSVTLLQPSFLGLAITFGVFWFAASSGARSADKTREASVWRWAVKSLRNFAFIYSALVVTALLVLWFSDIVNPNFSESFAEGGWKPNFTGDQILWAVVFGILFVANALAQALFTSTGLSIGVEAHGVGSNQLLTGGVNSVSSYKIWLYDAFGPWAFVGIVAVVVVVALISGALAAKKLGLKVSGVIAFWQGLVASLAITFSVAYFAGVQASATTTVEKVEVTSWAFWGVSFVGLLLSSVVVYFVAFNGASKLQAFTAGAYPRVFKLFRAGAAGETRHLGSRIFGIATSLVLIGTLAIPVTAASINRVWAITDGPAALGASAQEMLTKGSLADLKLYLKSKPSKKDVWFSDAILKEAQPTKGYEYSVSVMNKSDKTWSAGDLDAIVQVNLTKDDKTLVWSIDTTSKMTNPSWLIQHPQFKLSLAPTSVEVSLGKFLKKAGSVKIMVNDVKTKPGTYLAIPGMYKVKADGYKLIAATDMTVFTNQPLQKISVGNTVALPKGGDNTLNDGILKAARSCFNVASNGESKCVTKSKLKSTAKTVSGTVPAKFFDASLSNFKVSKVTCDSGKRKEVLTSATTLTSTGQCASTITYTKTFYESTTKMVPHYTVQTTCEAATVNGSGDPVYYLYDTDEWGDSYYAWWDDWGNSYESWELYTDPCYSQTSNRVQDGFTKSEVRGKKIGSAKLTSTVKSKVSVRAALDAKNKFALSK